MTQEEFNKKINILYNKMIIEHDVKAKEIFEYAYKVIARIRIEKELPFQYQDIVKNKCYEFISNFVKELYEQNGKNCDLFYAQANILLFIDRNIRIKSKRNKKTTL